MENETSVWDTERQLNIIAQAETNPQYGMNPTSRTLDDHIRLGVINLDKPPNPSSHQVASWVKKIMGVKHAGHGGTLEAETPGKPYGHRRAPGSP